MKCEKCGHLNNDSDSFCGMCGDALATPTQAESVTPSPSYSSEGYAYEEAPSQKSSQQDFTQQNQQYDYQPNQTTPTATASIPAKTSASDPTQILGIVALVLGVLSILSTCCSIFFIPGLGLPFGIAAVVCGALGMKKSKAAGKTNTMATVGLVMGIPALVVSIISTVISVCMIIFGAGASLFYEFF